MDLETEVYFDENGPCCIRCKTKLRKKETVKIAKNMKNPYYEESFSYCVCYHCMFNEFLKERKAFMKILSDKQKEIYEELLHFESLLELRSPY